MIEMYQLCAKIASYLGCISVGAIVSWYFTKEHYDKLVKEEIESIREVQKRKMENNDKKMNSDYKKMKDIIESESYVVKDFDPGEYKFNPGPKDDTFASPHLIPMETFDDADPAFEKISLDYYTEDNMLIENDEPVDISGTVGTSLINRFAKRMDLIIMYVRNESLGVDYEVTKIIGKWIE